jgi:acyl-CoA thioesterase
MADIKTIRNFFKRDRYCLYNGIQIAEVTREYALCKAELTDNHLNANNGVQGGFIFTIADFAFAVHANAMGKWTVSQNVGITFLKPPKGKVLFAKAMPLHAGSHTVLYKMEVFDELGTNVAYATANGYVLGDNPVLQKD